VAVTELGECHRQAVTAGAARTANAVGVVLALHRQTEVEHVGDRGHIDTPRRHVGGHQNLHLAIAQCHQAAIAQALTQGAVQGNSGKARLLQVTREAVALDLGAGKDDGLINGGVTQPVIEQLAFVLRVVGPEQYLLDIAVFFLG
jgi:hypothetical protein